MKCPKCGKEIANDSNFCEFCGSPVGKNSEKNKKARITLGVILVSLVGLAFLFMPHYNQAYERHFNSSEKENILQYGALLKQNEELQKRNRELLAIIDSLKKEIQPPSPKPKPQNQYGKQTTAEKQEDVSSGVKVSEPIDPRKLVEDILSRYEDLNNVKEKSYSAAIKSVIAIRDDIARKLDELGKYTTNTRRTENIKNSLPKDDEIARSIGKDKKGECYPNEYLKRNFDKSLKKVKELESTLK